MATIIQKPDYYSFLGNLKKVIIGSPTAVTVQLLQGNDIIFTMKYEPSPGGKISFSMADTIAASLPFELPGNSAYQSTDLYLFSVKINGIQAFSFYVIPGGIAGAGTAETFLPYNFLTWQPQVKYIHWNVPNWLRYVCIHDSCRLMLTAHFADESYSEIMLTALAKHKVYTFNLSFASVASNFEKQPVYFDVRVQQENTTISYIQRFVLTADKSGPDPDYFVFENTVGGIDTVLFTGQKSLLSEVESRQALFEDQTIEYDTDFNNIYKKHTGYFDTKLLQTWISEFFRSRNRFHFVNENDGTLRRICVSEAEIKVIPREPNSFAFKFAYAKQEKFLNLSRIGQLGDQLEFAMPDDSFFSLAPRLSEFPTADVGADPIIPVQHPFENTWRQLPLSAILESIRKVTVHGEDKFMYTADFPPIVSPQSIKLIAIEHNFVSSDRKWQYLSNDIWITFPGEHDSILEIKPDDDYWHLNNSITVRYLANDRYSDTINITKIRDGAKGETGPSLTSSGYWEADKQYYMRPKVRNRVIYKLDNKNYLTKTATVTTPIPVGTVPTNTDFWEEFTGDFELVATNILFAEDAYIAKLNTPALWVGDGTKGWKIWDEQIESVRQSDGLPKIRLTSNGDIEARGGSLKIIGSAGWQSVEDYMQERTDSIQSSIINVQSNLTVLDGKIATKVSQTDYNSLSGRVSTAESTITQLSGSITSTVEKVNNIQIGNRNYILGSNFFNNTQTTFRFPSADFFNENRGKEMMLSVSLKADKAIFTSGNKRAGIELRLNTTDGQALYFQCFWGFVDGVETNLNRRLITKFIVPTDKTIQSTGQNQTYIQGLSSGTVYIGYPQIELGNKASDWNIAPEDLQTGIDKAQSDASNAQTTANQAKADAATAQSAASTAQSSANTANNLLSDIASDNKLTPNEKQETKKEWDSIVSEYPKNTAQATKFGVSSAVYTTVYNTLSSYITPLLSNLGTTSDINGATFRANFKAYYDARTDLLNAISAKAKELADTAQTSANTAQNTADSKNRTYYQDTVPTVPSGGHKAGDLWYKTSLVDSSGNINADTTKNIYQLQYRWDGTTWRQINWSVSKSKIEQTDARITSIVESTDINSLGVGKALKSIIDQNATQIRLEVSSLQIGGRNLALNTSDKWSNDVILNNTVNQSGFSYIVLADSFVLGQKVTVSFDYKYTNLIATNPATARICFQGAGNVTQWSAGSWIVNFFQSLIDPTAVAKSGIIHVKYSFTITADHLKNSYFTTNIRHDYLTGTVAIKNLMIEVADNPSSWSPAPEDTKEMINNVSIQKIRYIRDWLNGSTSNTGNHIVQIKALDYSGNNIALNKDVSGNSTDKRITNGNTDTNPYADLGGGLKHTIVDLGGVYDIEKVQVWHYYADGRTYYKTKTEVSIDGVNWYTIFDSDKEGTYRETSTGRSYFVKDYDRAREAQKTADSKTTLNEVSSSLSITNNKISLASKTIELNGTTIAEAIKAKELNIGKFRVATDGKIYATDGEFSGKITADNGTIGGFQIGSNRIGTTANSNEAIGNNGLALYNDFIKFSNGSNIWAGIGTNVFAASSGGAALGRFENNTPSSSGTNYALYLRASGGANNIALTMDGGCISGLALKSSRINSSTTLNNSDVFISCGNGSNITLNLPATPEVGKIYFIHRINSGSVTINGNGKSIYTNQNTNGVSSFLLNENSDIPVGQYFYYKRTRNSAYLIYDGQYWHATINEIIGFTER